MLLEAFVCNVPISYQLLRFSCPCRAKDNYAKVVGTYGGASCFFLQINSRASSSPGKNVPDLWSDLLRSGSETNDTATTVCSTSVHLCITMLIDMTRVSSSGEGRGEPSPPPNAQLPQTFSQCICPYTLNLEMSFVPMYTYYTV